MKLLKAIACLFIGAPLSAAPIDDLFSALKMEETIGVLRMELLGHGENVAAQLLVNGGGAVMSRELAQLMKSDLMLVQIRSEIDANLTGTDLAQTLDFFQSETGASIVLAELNARRQLLGGIGASDAALACVDDEDLNAQISTLSEANDLVSRNTSAILNADIAFYRGLVDGGYMVMSQDEIIQDISTTADVVREQIEEWIAGSGCMAYKDMNPAKLQAYASFSKTSAGVAYNTAYFNAFEILYNELSYGLGLAISKRAKMSDL